MARNTLGAAAKVGRMLGSNICAGQLAPSITPKSFLSLRELSLSKGGKNLLPFSRRVYMCWHQSFVINPLIIVSFLYQKDSWRPVCLGITFFRPCLKGKPTNLGYFPDLAKGKIQIIASNRICYHNFVILLPQFKNFVTLLKYFRHQDFKKWHF